MPRLCCFRCLCFPASATSALVSRHRAAADRQHHSWRLVHFHATRPLVLPPPHTSRPISPRLFHLTATLHSNRPYGPILPQRHKQQQPSFTPCIWQCQLAVSRPLLLPLLSCAHRGWTTGLTDLSTSQEAPVRRLSHDSDGQLGDEEEGEARGGSSEQQSFKEGRGRNERKRAAQTARSLGLKLIELSPKELAKVVRWASLPEETLEAVLLAKTLTKKGKNGWRRQVIYIGGLLRGSSAHAVERAMHAAKDGTVPHDLDWGQVTAADTGEEFEDTFLEPTDTSQYRTDIRRARPPQS